MLRRNFSDSSIIPSTPPTTMKPSVLRRRQKFIKQQSTSDDNDQLSPNSILDSFCYAPSRQKRVTFASEVFTNFAPPPHRLQSISLNDLDHGISFSSKAAGDDAASISSIGSSSSSIGSSTSKRVRSCKALEKRIHKIEMQIMQTGFEIQVAANERLELERENDELFGKLQAIEYTEMGHDKLRESIDEMQYKSRKYTSKVAVLNKAVTYYDQESNDLLQQLKLYKAHQRQQQRGMSWRKEEGEES